MDLNIHFSPKPIAISVFTSFMYGAMYYGPFFGSTWIKLSKRDLSAVPQEKLSEEISRGMLLSALNALLSSLVLSVLVQIWRPSTWHANGVDDSKHFYGTITAFVVWLGFYLPVGLNTIAWEGKSCKLFLLNTGYHLSNVLLMSLILSEYL